MSIKLFKTALLIAFSMMLVSCGGKGIVAPDGSGIYRVLGVDFPKPVISLITFCRDIPDPDSVYGINREIFIMNPDGQYQHRLTFDPAEDDYPAFSPDGLALAFVSNRSSDGVGSHDIYRMDSIKRIVQLTNETWQFDSHATDWGPGYITAAQINQLIGAPFDVGRVIRLDPSGKVADFIDTGHIVSYDPASGTSPNLLVFSARPQGATYFGDLELYVLTEGISEAVRVTYLGTGGPEYEDLVFTRNAQFDSTGTKIIFQTNYWDNNWEIGYLSLTGDFAAPEPVRLTYSPADDVEPCWDQSGNWYAWSSNRNGNFEIYKQMVWDPNSPTPIPPITRLTDTPEDESNPDWGPYYSSSGLEG